MITQSSENSKLFLKTIINNTYHFISYLAFGKVAQDVSTFPDATHLIKRESERERQAKEIETGAEQVDRQRLK